MSKKTRNQKQTPVKSVQSRQVHKPSIAAGSDLPVNGNPATQSPKVGGIVKSIVPMNFAEIAMGTKQKNGGAPMSVPNGFVTQIPYNSSINSTILANPSPIPITSCYHALTTDPVVYSSILYLATSIISRVGAYNNPKDLEAQELVRSTIERIGKRKLLRGLLVKLWAGFSVIKLNWDLINGITSIKSIQVLPPNSILLAATPEGELDPEFGTMQYYYNINSGWQQSPFGYGGSQNAEFSRYGSIIVPIRQMTYNPMYVSAIPEEWRIIDTFNPVGLEGNYYGNSLINQIWSALTRKNNQIMKLEIATTYKAAPMVLFQTDTQTMVETVDGKYISKGQELREQMPSAAQTGYYVSEGMDAIKVVTIDNSADLDKILSTIYACNDEIRTGLITPNLVGNSGSYANAMANSSANSDIINNLTEDLIDTLINSLVKPVIKFGLNEDATEFGSFELLDNSLEDKALWSKILETTKGMGVIQPTLEDINFIRNKIGFTPVDSLTDDLIFQMTADILPLRGVNINGTKQDAKIPYANGGVSEVKKDQYAA